MDDKSNLYIVAIIGVVAVVAMVVLVLGVGTAKTALIGVDSTGLAMAVGSGDVTLVKMSIGDVSIPCYYIYYNNQKTGKCQCYNVRTGAFIPVSCLDAENWLAKYVGD
jgi:hypothetical protein